VQPRSTFFSLAAVLICCFFLIIPASASVTGSLALGSGLNTVSVGLTSITWNGQFQVSGTTDLTYDNPSQSLPIGSNGNLVDLTIATVLPLNDFMTFTAAPDLAFDLISIGPGSSNTTCAGLALFASCSVYAGSPFVLTQESTGTEIDLAAHGTATDNTSDVSDWMGQFSTTITALPGFTGVITPFDIQSFFSTDPTGKITSPYSGTFVATFTAIPEPSSLLMSVIGGSLILFAVSRRRQSNR
jgi:hypothetical protein